MVEYFVETVLKDKENFERLQNYLSSSKSLANSGKKSLVLLIDIERENFDEDSILFEDIVVNKSFEKESVNKFYPNEKWSKQFVNKLQLPDELFKDYLHKRAYYSDMPESNINSFGLGKSDRIFLTCSFTDLYFKPTETKAGNYEKYEHLLELFPSTRKTEKIEENYKKMAVKYFPIDKDYVMGNVRDAYIDEIQNFIKNNKDKIWSLLEPYLNTFSKDDIVRVMFTKKSFFDFDKDSNLDDIFNYELKIIKNEHYLFETDRLNNYMHKDGKDKNTDLKPPHKYYEEIDLKWNKNKLGTIKQDNTQYNLRTGSIQNENKSTSKSQINVYKHTINNFDLMKSYKLKISYLFYQKINSVYNKEKSYRNNFLDLFHHVFDLNNNLVDKKDIDIISTQLVKIESGNKIDFIEGFYEISNFNYDKESNWSIELNNKVYELYKFIQMYFYKKDSITVRNIELDTVLENYRNRNEQFLEYLKSSNNIDDNDTKKLIALMKNYIKQYFYHIKGNMKYLDVSDAIINKLMCIEMLEEKQEENMKTIQSNDIWNELLKWEEDGCENKIILKNDEDFYNLAGQLVYFIEKQIGGIKDLKMDSFIPYLSKNTERSFKNYILLRLTKYAHNLKMTKKFRCVLFTVLDTEVKTPIKENNISFLKGVLDNNNILFGSMANNKINEDKENEEEVYDNEL